MSRQSTNKEENMSTSSANNSPLSENWNALFYRELRELKPYYTNAGLEACDDLKALKAKKLLPTDKNASIAIFGAGYEGREIKYLLKENYTNLTGIDLNLVACRKLRREYRGNNHVSIIEANLLKYVPPKKFDCIIWLWCGISDFSREQQKEMLERIMKYYLKPGGIAIIDIPITSSMLNVQSIDAEKHDGGTYNQIAKIKLKYSNKFATYRGYIPSTRDIRVIAKETPGVNSVSFFYYYPKNDSSKKRSFLTLEKVNNVF